MERDEIGNIVVTAIEGDGYETFHITDGNWGAAYDAAERNENEAFANIEVRVRADYADGADRVLRWHLTDALLDEGLAKLEEVDPNKFNLLETGDYDVLDADYFLQIALLGEYTYG